MKTSNLATEALRTGDVGQCWEERLSGAAGTLKLQPFQSFRVRATAAGTVTIDGTLAATMVAGEILVFNAGSGQPYSVDQTTKQASECVIVITGAQFVQVARDTTRKI
jgi:hypothetical protein